MAPAETFQESSSFLSDAQALIPKLVYTDEEPLETVSFEPDDTVFLRHRRVAQDPMSVHEETWYSTGADFIVDFEGHRTGYLSFDLDAQGINVDSPARLRLTFGEVPADVVEEFYPSKSWISTSWFPYEVISVDELPQKVQIKRRHAFRYVRFQVLEISPKFKVRFHNIKSHAVTSATNHVKPVDLDGFEVIDQVGLRTLRDCMQTVYEDGPRRDRRLWLGDLRLQALVNYVTFQNNDLVKRCLYLFAGLQVDGKIMACLYERPRPATSGDYIVDYELLFVVTLLEYVQATQDTATGLRLFPICRQILTRTLHDHIRDGLFTPQPEVWYFIDWQEQLDRQASIQGVFIFALKAAQQLGKLINVNVDYSKEIQELTQGAMSFFDTDKGVFVCNGQVSWASQAWMGMAQILPAEKHVQAILSAIEDPNAIKANTPYSYHYVLEALHRNDAKQQCLALAKTYFGGMVDRGADTFWEAYSENDSLFSPYHDVHNNSFCHAWSCTVSWFLRV
ncbi:bacterial alpha-L-rhamnosidase domain protein [Zychaea mexicana]|uniref:bacterial alpha-L-rhamnosidase domain protein n=1 Tax=Zychaea mexicana TaxID=64656 RepID=UPI0022FF2DE4|nr:bacterial alpha-L-rhamnosidase domain protein [Zychaea mexicana]KAI9488489.1 bacterial alpha-L-rhamnosidase domain protein [Zychaea mexicana]